MPPATAPQMNVLRAKFVILNNFAITPGPLTGSGTPETPKRKCSMSKIMKCVWFCKNPSLELGSHIGRPMGPEGSQQDCKGKGLEAERRDLLIKENKRVGRW